jgi:hypothetical protein
LSDINLDLPALLELFSRLANRWIFPAGRGACEKRQLLDRECFLQGKEMQLEKWTKLS